jgi:S1-C subfamily serine protease
MEAGASATPAASPIIGANEGRPIWVRHPTQDIAAIAIQAPPEFAKAAIPLSWLADDRTFARYNVRPGDEMMALGFPRGLSSNRAGFPILRWGRVASYPLTPVSNFPTFLMDFRVFDGNSGGPVFMADPDRGRGPGAAAGTQGPGAYFVAGVLTKQVESRGDRLEIGVVVHARHVRDAIAMLDRAAPAPSAPVKATLPVRVQPDAAGGR